jgi:pyruvate/2-oxoglutarate dehydrogenase complex dihydrolipoamide acyltransferase (E2) component
MRILKALSLVVLAGLLHAPPAAAQQASGAEHAASSAGAVDAALAGHDLAVDRHRTRLADLLSAPQVRDLAHARGIDIERVEAVAEGLSDTEMLGLAPLLENAAEALEARQLGNVTISVAAVIIILLILILVT